MSLDLDTIKARLAAACPGPWTGMTIYRSIDGNCLALARQREVGGTTIAATLLPGYSDLDTVPLLLHAREDMDALVAEVERLRAAERENAALRAEVERLRILGPDTEARVVVEARAIASDMLKPVVDSWRAECDKERADTIAYLHMEAERIRRGEYNPANRENALLDAASVLERGKHRRKP